MVGPAAVGAVLERLEGASVVGRPMPLGVASPDLLAPEAATCRQGPPAVCAEVRRGRGNHPSFRPRRRSSTASNLSSPASLV